MKFLKNLLEQLKRNKKRKKTYSELEKELKYKDKKTDTLWRKVFLILRVIWAVVPLLLLVATGWFTWWLVDGIGRNQLNFDSNSTFINIIAADLIVNVIGVVVIVMRFLFPPKQKLSEKDNQSDDELFELPSSH